MRTTRRKVLEALGSSLIILVAAVCSARANAADDVQTSGVQLLRVPEGGLQPQVVAYGEVVHLTYFKGEPAHGDVYYRRSTDGGNTWSAPLRVNSQPGSAVATGTIRGAHLAVGKEGRVHVAWNGSDRATPRVNGGAPMLYARLKDDASAFEPQRNLMAEGFDLDGGGSVAADREGHVYVAWHAGAIEGGGEENRRVFLTRSADEGKTWSTPTPVWAEPTGVCACCQLRLMAQNGGKVDLLYRAATQMVNRDTYFLQSNDAGRTFQGTKVHPWRVGACPMSSYALTQRKGETLAAWESTKQVFWSPLTVEGKSQRTLAVPRGQNQKHPALVVNERGETLLVWTEGTGWGRGGKVRWQAYDGNGEPIAGTGGERSGVQVWSFATAWSQPNGRFTIVY